MSKYLMIFRIRSQKKNILIYLICFNLIYALILDTSLCLPSLIPHKYKQVPDTVFYAVLSNYK